MVYFLNLPVDVRLAGFLFCIPLIFFDDLFYES
jgi:hypothetical protein